MIFASLGIVFAVPDFIVGLLEFGMAFIVRQTAERVTLSGNKNMKRMQKY